jgi:colicin import membrane protein
MNRACLSWLSALRVASFVVTATLSGALAWATPAEDAERVRLTQERATIDAQYATRQNECNQRFVVTSCVEDAKRERRRALDALRSRQIALDEARRKERSAARRSELSGNAAEQARREGTRASRPAAAASEPVARHDEAPRSPEPHRSTADRASLSKRPVDADTKGAAAADRSAKEGRSRATFEARKEKAAEHRQDVLDKTTQRAQQHPPAAPLPIPAP